MHTTSSPSSTKLRCRAPWRLAGGLTSTIAALALLGGCSAVADSSTSDAGAGPETAAEAVDTEHDGTATDAPEPTATSTEPVESATSPPAGETEPEAEPEPIEPQSFSGTGSEVVILDPLGEDVFYASVTHSGSSNVALWSVDENGQNIDLLVNEIGSYEGEVAVNFGDEPAALRVEADGDWSIKLVPLQDAPRWDGASHFEATGDSIVIIDGVADGLTPVTLTHDGESNFAIWAWGESYPDLIVNDIGAYDGTTLLPDGSLVLQVTADGTWTISTS